MSIIHGFYVEKHKSWLMSAATRENGVVTCHDVSGYLGSWEGFEGGFFSPSVDNKPFCKIAMKKAMTKQEELNNPVGERKEI